MEDNQHPAAVAKIPTFIEFDDLFQEEHQHILGAMLQRLGPAARQFFEFLQCYDRPNLNSHTLLADLRQILNSLPYDAEESRVNAFLRGMQRDVEVCKDCMPENGAADIQWYWLGQTYHVIRARFREWWELNGKEVTDAIDIITKASLDNGIVQSAKEPNIASPTTELHQEKPRQTLPEAQETRTETLTKDDGIKDAESADNDVKQYVARLQAVIQSTREEKESERALAQSRHEEIQHKFKELKDDGTMVKENIRSLVTTQDESITLRLALSDAKEHLEEKDACLMKVFEEKKQLSAEYTKVRGQLEGEMVLVRAQLKALQNQLDSIKRLLTASQVESTNLRQTLDQERLIHEKREREHDEQFQEQMREYVMNQTEDMDIRVQLDKQVSSLYRESCILRQEKHKLQVTLNAKMREFERTLKSRDVLIESLREDAD
ncbi:hypothetical protein DFS34DRAFT_686695 [Phlyctochytrium arcticum]|nr:hypothetical protein DFS34DRAFT_686695 [Phlyctochytrium arcticum]